MTAAILVYTNVRVYKHRHCTSVRGSGFAGKKRGETCKNEKKYGRNKQLICFKKKIQTNARLTIKMSLGDAAVT